ncbi:unnamed protein product [Phytomonas sp. Hart1]|nr:unnamed protein product [Phytomonas sp. Hart1]|eukprot:CCW69311.1 unnamed protein product [Phytomonas sp. isolate Hart1]
MQVFFDQQEGVLRIKGELITFKPTHSTGDDVVRFAAREVTQLLCSRKDDKAAKVATVDQTHFIQFDHAAARKEFVEGVVKAQASTNNTKTIHQDWITSTLCEVAVEVGILNESELHEILREESHRGVVQTFDALESLVDRSSFRLKPITEQMQNDVFRQIPILAVIFAQHVVNEDTRKSFWEDVVRKYFCFSRTFLDDEIEKVLKEVEGRTPETNPSLPTADASLINASSMSALPRQVAEAEPRADAEVDEIESLLRQTREDSSQAGSMAFYAFGASRHLPRLVLQSTNVALDVPPLEVINHTSEIPRVYSGRSVRTTLPSEPTRKEALETLRKIWRTQPKLCKTLLDHYKSAKKDQAVSFIEAKCFQKVESLIYSPN